MKLRVRINRRTSRVELLGEDPSVKELADHVTETLLSSEGLSADTHFSLSLNGSELLTDSGQTLSSCGIVSGDLICVVLPEPAAGSSTPSRTSRTATSSSETRRQQNQPTKRTAAMTTNQQPSSSRPAAASPSEEPPRGEPPHEEPPHEEPPRWEPMLCGEAEAGQAPLSLELLLHSAPPSRPTDALVVTTHLLMLETGFLPQSGELKASDMPAGWRSPSGVYKLQYSHPLCGGSLAMVVCVSMGSVLVINATLKVNETVDTVRKLCLNPSDYVTDRWAGDSAAAAFRDLSKLSRVFKDQLAYPLIAAARDAMALPVAFGLAALPPELVLRVLRLLDVGSVLRLAAVCRHLSASAADSSLWRHLYRRDFSDRDLSRSRDTDWKELYKKFHQVRRERRHHVTGRRGLPPFQRNPFVPAPLHPPLPGIIGGDYDQGLGLPRPLWDQGPGLPRLLLPRYDPIGPPPGLERRLPRVRPPGGRAADVRRGFI